MDGWIDNLTKEVRMYLTETEINTALNRGWAVTQCPNRGVSLDHTVQKDKHIWQIRDGWQTARIDQHKIYEDHKVFDNLMDAIERDWR